MAAGNGSNSASTNTSVTAVCTDNFGDAGKFVHTAAYCLVLVLALAGNSLVILSVRKNQRLWTSANYLIVNMAASDLLLPIIAVPRMIVEVLLGRETWLVVGTPGLISCKLVYFLQDVSTAVSVQSLVVITVERFFAVSFPLRAASMMQSKVKYIIPVTWAVAFSLHSVYLYTFQLCDVGKGRLLCCQKWPSNRSQAIYFFIILSLVFAVPLALMIVMYSLIVVRLRRRKFHGDHSGSRRRRKMQIEKQNRNVLKMAVAIVVVFFSCFCPLVILALIRSSRAVHLQKCAEETYRAVAKFLAQSNCALNPFIYFVFNEQFRQSFKSYLSIVFCCKKRAPDTSYQDRQTTYYLKRLQRNGSSCTAPSGVQRSIKTESLPEPANV